MDVTVIFDDLREELLSGTALSARRAILTAIERFSALNAQPQASTTSYRSSDRSIRVRLDKGDEDEAFLDLFEIVDPQIGTYITTSKIMAIKRVRERDKIGLKDAKEHVDNLPVVWASGSRNYL